MGYIHIFNDIAATEKLILFAQPPCWLCFAIRVSRNLVVLPDLATNYGMDPVQNSGFYRACPVYSIFTSLARYYSDNIYEYKN